MNTSPVRRVGIRLGALGVAVLAIGVTFLTAPAARAAGATGDVYIVHGVAGSSYDVVVDGDVIGDAVKPKTVVGPLALSAGSHRVALQAAGTDVAAATFTVKAGQSLDVVAHRLSDVKRAPALTTFVNDLSSVGPGKTRLTVAHTAAAPPADIVVDGTPLFRNVANAEALTIVVPAKTYKVEIQPAAGGAAILGPTDLPIAAGTLTRVFAIGDAATGSMDAVVQTIKVSTEGAGTPDRVRTGDGGQAATSFVDYSSGLGGAASVSLALLLGSGGVVLLARRGDLLRRARAGIAPRT